MELSKGSEACRRHDPFCQPTLMATAVTEIHCDHRSSPVMMPDRPDPRDEVVIRGTRMQGSLRKKSESAPGLFIF